MVKLDIKNKLDKILLIVLAIVLVVTMLSIFFTVFLPKEIRTIKIFALLGLSLNFYGTILLAMTLLKPDNKIKDLSGTYYGGNPDLEKDMLESRRAALWGLILIVIGFLFQIIDVISSYYLI
jgi:Na+/proline symporter